jgi:hypothetical protein
LKFKARGALLWPKREKGQVDNMSETHDATRRKLVMASTVGAGLVLASASGGIARAAEKGSGRGREKEVGAMRI